MASAVPRELIARAQQLAAEPLNNKLPNAGRQRNVVLAPIIGQVRRATIVQLHLTLSDGCKVKAARLKPARVKPEATDQPIAAQAAQA
jgi:hypothetical protein